MLDPCGVRRNKLMREKYALKSVQKYEIPTCRKRKCSKGRPFSTRPRNISPIQKITFNIPPHQISLHLIPCKFLWAARISFLQILLRITWSFHDLALPWSEEVKTSWSMVNVEQGLLQVLDADAVLLPASQCYNQMRIPITRRWHNTSTCSSSQTSRSPAQGSPSWGWGGSRSRLRRSTGADPGVQYDKPLGFRVGLRIN